MPIKYVGRTTDFRGKTLWEILGNLTNFGVGRIIARSRFERYPEPSYVKIVKVEALPNEEVRKVRVYVQKTFRGKTYPALAEIESASYKTDYVLIPKDQEAAYCRDVETRPTIVLPRTIAFPPLLKELVLKETKAQKIALTEEPKLLLHYRKGRDKNFKVAEEGETPSIEITMGLGEPANPRLYANIQI